MAADDVDILLAGLEGWLVASRDQFVALLAAGEVGPGGDEALALVEEARVALGQVREAWQCEGTIDQAAWERYLELGRRLGEMAGDG